MLINEVIMIKRVLTPIFAVLLLTTMQPPVQTQTPVSNFFAMHTKGQVAAIGLSALAISSTSTR